MFDCNAHPTVSGLYIPGYQRNMPASASNYLKQTQAGARRILGVNVSMLQGLHEESHAQLEEMFNFLASQLAVTYAVQVAQPDSSSNLRYLGEEASLRGAAGLKVHPSRAGWVPSMAEAEALMETCVRADLYLGVCGWTAHSASAAHGKFLSDIIAAAKTVPSLRLLIFHAGGFHLPDLARMADRLPNILLETSFSLLRLGKREGVELCASLLAEGYGLAFGTDWPDYRLADYSEALDSLADALPSVRLYESYLWRNAVEFLQLDADKWRMQRSEVPDAHW